MTASGWRWLGARSIGSMSYASSVAVSREHRRAKTDRWTPSCSNALLGWLRGERDRKMVAIPTSGRRCQTANREHDLVGEQIGSSTE